MAHTGSTNINATNPLHSEGAPSTSPAAGAHADLRLSDFGALFSEYNKTDKTLHQQLFSFEGFIHYEAVFIKFK